jgi:hypothetical protein
VEQEREGGGEGEEGRIPINHNKFFMVRPKDRFGSTKYFIRVADHGDVRTQTDEIILRLVGIVSLPCHLHLQQSVDQQ